VLRLSWGTRMVSTPLVNAMQQLMTVLIGKERETVDVTAFTVCTLRRCAGSHPLFSRCRRCVRGAVDVCGMHDEGEC
jgi:hypothetical protein